MSCEILKPSDRQRFQKFLRRDDKTGCLVWCGAKDTNGYGLFVTGSRSDKTMRCSKAHRIAWLLAGKRITEHRPQILHDCPNGDNKACCEVSHLWSGSHDENHAHKAMKGMGRESVSGLPYGVTRRGDIYEGAISRLAAVGGYRFCGRFDSVDAAAAAVQRVKDEALAVWWQTIVDAGRAAAWRYE